MADRPWDAARLQQLANLLAAGKSYTEAAALMGCTKGAVANGARRLQAEGVPVVPDSTFRETADGAYAELTTTKPIRTLEDAIAAADVDLSVWYVDRWECVAWTTPMKVEQGQDAGGKWKAAVPLQTQQYRVKVYLKRLLPRTLQLATEAILERMKEYAPKYPKLGKVKRANGEPFLGVVACFDAHIGKLCWAPETGDNYDLKIAEQVFRNAVEDLLAETGNRPVARWVLPLGNDYLNIDNAKGQTTAGTPQDVDGRYAKVIETGELAFIWAVERLMQTAPVHIPYIPGNHDYFSSLHLARTVAAWFRRCDRVTVDYGPSPRKYVHYGATLIGLTHGNEEKTESLPAIMATERPAEWATSRCREWLLGHHHRKRQWQTKPVDTHEGVTTRVLSALTTADAWHHRRGYIGGPDSRAAEVYWYGRDRGYAGHAIAPARAG